MTACACPASDPFTCLQMREPNYHPIDEWDDDYCDCACHGTLCDDHELDPLGIPHTEVES